MSSPASELLAAFRAYLDRWTIRSVRDFRAEIDWDDAGAHARAQRACLPRPSRPRGRDRAAGRAPLVALLARNRGELRWGQTYTAADFGQRFIDNYGWIELFGTRGHFANDRRRGGLPDPRPRHRLSGPPPHRRRALRAADRRHRMAQGRGRLRRPRRPARSSTIRPTSTTRCAPAASRCLRSISGAAVRWRRNRRSRRPASPADQSFGSSDFGQ